MEASALVSAGTSLVSCIQYVLRTPSMKGSPQPAAGRCRLPSWSAPPSGYVRRRPLYNQPSGFDRLMSSTSGPPPRAPSSMARPASLPTSARLASSHENRPPYRSRRTCDYLLRRASKDSQSLTSHNGRHPDRSARLGISTREQLTELRETVMRLSFAERANAFVSDLVSGFLERKADQIAFWAHANDGSKGPRGEARRERRFATQIPFDPCVSLPNISARRQLC